MSEIQDDGKIKLSMLSESEEKEKQMQNNQNRRSGGRDFRSNKSDDRKQGFSKFKRY